MSSVQSKTMVMQQEEYTWVSGGWKTSEAKDSVPEKLVDGNVKCLLGLGIVPIIVGISTSIWPIALVALGPWLLALLDINQRRRGRMQ